MKNKLAIVVPAYNEEKVLKQTIKILTQLIHDLQPKQIDSDSFILFVDDGSTDQTWNFIKTASLQNPMIRGLKLARKFGHEYALWAGLREVR